MNRRFQSLSDDERAALAASRQTLVRFDRDERLPAGVQSGPEDGRISYLPPLIGHWTFVGDVHGDLKSIPKLGHSVIQIGDMGLGFIRDDEDTAFIRNRDDLWFIRGNHDHPARCRSHPRYLGDWGSHEFMFWVSGAWSIDQNFRVEGVSWWRDEELSAADGQRAFADYIAVKPRVMITHDGPASLFGNDGVMEIPFFKASSTASLLQAMWEAHQPEVWVFGHHHESRDFTLGTTRFCCLDVREALTLTFHADGSIEWPDETLRPS